MCVLKWFLKLPFSEKVLAHWLQICTLECVVSAPFSEKAFGHRLQGNGFFPLCILKCFYMHHLRRNTFDTDCKDVVSLLCVFLNDSSSYLFLRKFRDIDFSPVCTLKCIFSEPFSEKAFGHSLQGYGYLWWMHISLLTIQASKQYVVSSINIYM